MKHDPLDNLLQLAWLEGWINTHGAYEKAIAKREVRVRASTRARARTIEKLEASLAELRPEPPLTVGVLLRRVRSATSLRPQELFSRIGVTQNIYRLMERDAISPVKIPVDVWKRVLKLFNLPVEELAAMLRRTQQLVSFRPSFQGVLARHKAQKKKGQKVRSLEQAFAEMYARAELPIPDETQRRLDDLISGLKE
jgi:hypothetical protein